jgi:hypothetical protein
VLVEILNTKINAELSGGFRSVPGGQTGHRTDRSDDVNSRSSHLVCERAYKGVVIVSDCIVMLLTGSSKSKCSQRVKLCCLYPLKVAMPHL